MQACPAGQRVDGGSEFMAEFEGACEELSIPLNVLPPGKPTYNGGVERGNRTFRAAFYYRCMRFELKKALNKYYTYRPHKALGGLTPMAYILNIAKRYNYEYIYFMTYSLDFRQKVLSVRERDNLTFAQVADRFSVGIASVVRWSNCLDIKPYVRIKVRKIDLILLAADVEKYPDSYQFERAERFGVCQKAIWQALRRLGVTYKKKP